MEETAVRTGSNLVDDIGLKIDVDGTGNVFSGRSFGEERAEPAIRSGRACEQTTVGL